MELCHRYRHTEEEAGQAVGLHVPLEGHCFRLWNTAENDRNRRHSGGQGERQQAAIFCLR